MDKSKQQLIIDAKQAEIERLRDVIASLGKENNSLKLQEELLRRNLDMTRAREGALQDVIIDALQGGR